MAWAWIYFNISCVSRSGCKLAMTGGWRKGSFLPPTFVSKEIGSCATPSDLTSVYEWTGDTMFGWFLYLVMVIFGCFLFPCLHVCMGVYVYACFLYVCGDTYVCMCACPCEQALGGQGLMLGIIRNRSSILFIKAASLSQVQSSQ